MYVVFFLPTSINAAWLSVASGLGVLIVPLSYGHTAHLQAVAAVIAVVAIAAGRAAAWAFQAAWNVMCKAETKHVGAAWKGSKRGWSPDLF